jgi:Glycosyl hydrolase catalytic core
VKLRRTLRPALLAIPLVLALLAPASSGAFVVGVADQSPSLFGDPFYRQLAPKRTRLITPYDSVFKDRRNLDTWLGAARAAGQEVVVAFNPPATMKCPNLDGARGCKLVSSASFRSAFRAFHARYPWVRIIQPWNEVNNLTQPTVHRPDALVTYYQVVRQVCRSCRVLGADIQDLPNMVAYTKQLLADFRRLHVATPQLWGVHNYTDTNRFVPDLVSNMRKLVKLLPGRIWVTETGGLFRFQPQNSRQTFRPDLNRQARAMQAVFAEATHYQSKIQRVYLYQWFASNPANRWDSGILDAHGQPRPVYNVLMAHAGLFR